MNINNHFKYNFIEVNFYEYTIRMTIIDNTKMYLVSDLLKQYNKINNTNKSIRDWMKRKDTQELLQYYRDITLDCSFAHPENNEDNFVDIHGVIMKIDYKINNTDKRIHDWFRRKDTQEFLEFLETQNSGENIFSSKNNDDDSINIPGVIMKIDYENNKNWELLQSEKSYLKF